MSARLLRGLSLVLLISSLAAGPAQGGEPPPDPLERCLTEGLASCLLPVLRTYGWLVALLVLVAAGALWLLSAFPGGAKKAIEEEVQRGVRDFLRGDPFDQTTRNYLEKAIEDYRRFTLRGVGERAREINPPELEEAYVSLRVVAETAEGPGLRSMKGARDVEYMAELARGGEGMLPDRGAAPMDLAEALAHAPRMAIVGVAGSGKTTILQWVGLAMARALLGQDREMKPDQRAIVERLGSPLVPVLVPLREYNRHCLERSLDRNAQSLLDFMAVYLSGRHPTLDLTPDFFRRHLERGAMLMLDGLDEVAPEDRPAVRAAIEQLVREFRESPTRCLVTSRSYAYFGTARLGEGFARADVQPLTREQRVSLIRNWYRAIHPHSPDEADRNAEDLNRRIDWAEPKIQELARTPLMATIFGIVHYEQRELPNQRAELYERCVEILLTEPHHKEDEAGLSLQYWGGIDPHIRLARLAYAAFEMTRLGQKGDALLEDDLVDLLWPAFMGSGDEAAARKEARAFVRLAADRGGLLEEQGGRYGFFTHRTFREYLAGRYLAEEISPDQQREFLADRVGDDLWEEPIRLAAGYLAIRGERRPNEFVRLLASINGEPERHAHGVTVALLSLADLTLGTGSRVQPGTRQEIVGEALRLLEPVPPVLPVRLRDRVGRALGEAGDPRIDPFNPSMVFIPAGRFRMGTSPEDEVRLAEQGAKVWEDEKPAHTVELSAFEIGRFPVTNAEFRAFWEDGGYEDEAFWSAEGWRWRRGQWESDLSVYSEELRQLIAELLAVRPVEKRDRPFLWDDPERSLPNLPVVGVCWFEAEAYCNWLSARTGQKYSLPTEAQWERAARGTDGRLWPWGDEWDPRRCNSSEGEDPLRRTSPVGIYPDGASAEGALDMVGNVWEWCADRYAPDEYRRRAGAVVRDPRGPETGGWRVVRGGSWYSVRARARCAVRDRFLPDDFNYVLGFRLVRSHDFRSWPAVRAAHGRRPRLKTGAV